MKRRVLIAVHTTTWLYELGLVAERIRRTTDAEPVWYLVFSHWIANTFRAECAARGEVCLLDPVEAALDASFPAASAAAPAAASAVAPPLLKRLLRRSLPRLAPYLRELAEMRERTRIVRKLIKRVRPEILLLGGDMVGYDTAIFIKAAHEAGIATVIIPGSMSNGLEQAEVYYVDASYHVRDAASRVIARLFPKWVRVHKDRALLRCPAPRVLALELARLAPPVPWVYNSGYADAIAMESEAMIDYYVEAGLSREPMVLTGMMSLDVMAAQLADAARQRRRLCAELGLDPDRPLILSALPPDFLYVNGGRPQCDFQVYAELVEFWVDSLAAERAGCNVVICLHPSVNVEEMRHIERDGLRISTWKTADLVPLCDVYVASVSSTIRWAIACGKPVLNYDVYRYRYTDFLGVAGVLLTEEQAEFRDLLRRLATDEAYRRELQARQQEAASRWGPLDGRCGDRIMALLARFAELGTAAAPRASAAAVPVDAAPPGR